MLMWLHPGYLLFVLIPTLVIGLLAQAIVKSAFARASRIPSRRGLTGAQAAAALLDREGVHDVTIEPVGGMLSDHYDPSKRTLRLSQGVYREPSIAAVAVAAHEAGHALQHKTGYAPLALRSGIVPIVNGGFFIAQIALMIGLFFMGGLGGPLFKIACLGYGLFFLFTLVTLPVEFNASRRALAALRNQGLITLEEEPAVRRVLRAAALTYVAAAVTALIQLLYILSLGRDD
jgi:Zn-dependent membrane protease YugP